MVVQVEPVYAVKLHTEKNALVATDLLNGRDIPLFDEQYVPLLRILTDRGTKYCGKKEAQAIQQDTVHWITFYNKKQLYSGKHCDGKTP